MNSQKPHTNLVTTLSIFALLAATVSAALVFSVAAQRGRRERAPLAVLQSSGTLHEGPFQKALAAGAQGGRHVFALDAAGGVTAFERGGRAVKRIPLSARGAEAIAADSQEHIYVSGSDSVLRVFDFEGRQLRQFPIPATRSFAVLSDGSVVVASPARGKLLHLFSPAGLLLKSFADLKVYDADARENEFLNLGKVMAGLSGEIYFVSVYAPRPYAARFTGQGELINEFNIEGEAVTFQQGKANGFLAGRRADLTGGITVITSAAVEPATGRLWVAMNGLSTTATLYEYDPSGVKLGEYAFLRASPSGKRNLTHMQDIAVDGASIRVLSWGALYDFNRGDVVEPGPAAQNQAQARPASSGWWGRFVSNFLPSGAARPRIPQTGCPEEQDYSCSANCPEGSSPTSVDCKAQIPTRLTIGDVVTKNTCIKETLDATPGSTKPGGCEQTVEFCNAEKAGQPPVTGTITVKVSCNAVPPSPTPTPPRGGGGQEPCYVAGDCPDGDDDDGSGGVGPSSPVLVDVAGDGFRLTSAAAGVLFDLNGDGRAERLSWTEAGSDDSWLALDRDGDGRIKSGRELFGNFTPPVSANSHGFTALAEFDKREQGGNPDGVIDAGDSVFARLRLWRDSNHDGVSQPEELHTLPSLGVSAVSLDYRESRREDEYGNRFRYRAKVWDEKRARVGRWAWDVFLTSAP